MVRSYKNQRILWRGIFKHTLEVGGSIPVILPRWLCRPICRTGNVSLCSALPMVPIGKWCVPWRLSLPELTTMAWSIPFRTIRMIRSNRWTLISIGMVSIRNSCLFLDWITLNIIILIRRVSVILWQTRRIMSSSVIPWKDIRTGSVNWIFIPEKIIPSLERIKVTR